LVAGVTFGIGLDTKNGEEVLKTIRTGKFETTKPVIIVEGIMVFGIKISYFID